MEGLDPRLRIFLIAFGAFVTLILILIISNDYRRRRGLAALANELGFSYEREATQLLEHLESFRLFPAGSNMRIMNVLKGEVGRASVWLLDYSYFETGGKKGSRNEYSVCVLRSPDLKLPYFYLRYQMPGVDRLGPFLARKGILSQSHPISKAFGGGDIDFPEDEIFSKKFVLQGKEEVVRPLFDFDLRQHLLRFAGTLVRIEGNRDILLFTTGISVLPKAAREVIQQATDVFTLFSQRTASGKAGSGGYVLNSLKEDLFRTKAKERIPLQDLSERTGAEKKGRGSSIALKGIVFLIGAILVVVGSVIIITEIQGTLPGRADPLSSKFIIGLLFLIIGLGIPLQITVGPALKRRHIKRQLKDMSVIEGSVDNPKGGKGDKGG